MPFFPGTEGGNEDCDDESKDHDGKDDYDDDDDDGDYNDNDFFSLNFGQATVISLEVLYYLMDLKKKFYCI